MMSSSPSSKTKNRIINTSVRIAQYSLSGVQSNSAKMFSTQHQIKVHVGIFSFSSSSGEGKTSLLRVFL